MSSVSRTIVGVVVWALVFGASAALFAVWWHGAWSGDATAGRFVPLLLAVWPILLTGAVGISVWRDRTGQVQPGYLGAEAVMSVAREVCGEAASGLSPTDVLQKLAAHVTEELPVDAVFVWVRQEGGAPVLAAVAGSGAAARFAAPQREGCGEFPAFLEGVLSGQVRYAVTVEPRDISALRPMLRGRGRWTLVGVPLSWHGEVSGVLCAGLHGTEQAKAARYVETLGMLAELAAGAASHARLREQLEREQRHFAQVFEGMLAAGQAAMSGKDLFDVAKELIAQVRKTLGVDRASLWVLSPDGNELRGLVGVARNAPVRDERGWAVPMSKVDHPLVQCLASGEMSVRDDGYPSAAAPLMIGSEKIGVLTVDNATSKQPLSPDAVRSLRVFAEHCALAVRNSQLLEAREKEAQFKGVTLTAITVAHQINNALVGVVSSAELLERASAGLDAKQVQLVRNIVQSGKQIAEFVRKLSNVTRIATVRYVGNVEMLDVAAASEGTAEQSGNGRTGRTDPEAN